MQVLRAYGQQSHQDGLCLAVTRCKGSIRRGKNP